MSAGGKGSGKQRVNEYYLSIHYGICQAPFIFKKITYKDKVIWSGSVSSPSYVDVHLPNLMGGRTQEGGVSGRIYFMPGTPDQVAPDALARRLGLTPETCPAFRGVASVFFTGGALQIFNPNLPYGQGDIIYNDISTIQSEAGFYWTANNPFLEGVKIEGESIHGALGSTYSVIGSGQHNPAHFIYAALISQSWGMGGAEWFIDKPAFLDVAEALYIEEFGLSLKWNQQEPIETFVGEVLDHIQATIFVNPTSGLLSIKLLRGDYDLNDLPQINAGNAKLVKYERKLYGQTANEVVLSWTNPENEQTETISAQDLANVEIQGSPVSTNRDYYMIRSAALAQRILDRDLRTVSAPLASLEIEVDRRGSKLVPGGLARVDFPERKIYDMICRIGRIDYGKPLDSRIKISLIEDIFALDLPEPTTPPRSAWENVQVPPSPVDHSQVITIPAFFANRLAANMQYPEVIGGVLAAKDGMDVIGFDLLSEAVDVTGASQWANQGEKTMLGRAQILTPLYQEAQSLITGIPLTRSLRNPHVGAFVAIGSGGDHAMEFALISAYDEEANAWVLERGILDTVPRSWEVGTPVWFIPIDANIADTKDFKAVGETVSFKLLTRTSLGTLPFDDADEVYGMMSARPHAPLRPANVKINGVGFGKVDATGATELVVSWSNRNRLYEDGQVVRWNEGNVTPEYLQQTIITVFRQNGDLMYYRKGLWTETQFTIPIAWVQSETKIFVRVSSQRKGLASIQSYGLWVENIPQVADPAPPPASDDGPAPPPPPDDPEDPTPDPIDGIEDPPLPDLGGGPGGWN